MISKHDGSFNEVIPQKGITTLVFIIRLSAVAYFLSLAYSQWYYAGIDEGTFNSVVPKNLTSILVISIGLLLVSLLERFSHRHTFKTSDHSNLIIVFSLFFVFSTFMSVIIGIWRSGLNFDTLEGIKSLSATLCGVLLVRHISVDFIFFLRAYAYIFGTVVVFSLIQISLGINWATKNSFFTVGAENRWWDLNSAWGPFALSGKNVFGIILVLSFSFLSPITFLTNIFKRTDRYAVSCILVLDAFLILLSRSRTSIALLLVNLAILLIFYTIYQKNPIPITFSLLFIPIAGGIFFNRNTSWILSTQSSVARSNSLSAALMAPDSNFFFGTGYNSIFQLTASTFGNSLSQAGTQGINVDNYFVRRSLEGGFLGLLSFLAVIATLGYLFVSRNRFGKQGRALGICAGLLFIDISFASSTGDFLSFQLVNCFFFLILALLAGGLKYIKS